MYCFVHGITYDISKCISFASDPVKQRRTEQCSFFHSFNVGKDDLEDRVATVSVYSGYIYIAEFYATNAGKHQVRLVVLKEVTTETQIHEWHRRLVGSSPFHTVSLAVL